MSGAAGVISISRAKQALCASERPQEPRETQESWRAVLAGATVFLVTGGMIYVAL